MSEAKQPERDEILEVVDENDLVIGKAPRALIHSDRLFHRQVFVLLVNDLGEVLLQQRSVSKQFDPGRWTTSASGHVGFLEDYYAAAEREVREELGLNLSSFFCIGKTLALCEAGSELCGGPSSIFLARINVSLSRLSLQSSEVSRCEWVQTSELRKAEYEGLIRLADGELLELAQEFRPVLPIYLRELHV